VTWVYHEAYSGESQDTPAEIVDRSFPLRNVEVQSSRGRTGSWGIVLKHNGGQGWLFGTQGTAENKGGSQREAPPSNTKVLALQGGFGLNGSPSAASMLCTLSQGALNLTSPGLRVNADRSLQFVVNGGSTSGAASTTLLPATGLMDVVAFWVKHRGVWWCTLHMNGVEEIPPFELGGFAFGVSGGGGSNTPQISNVGHINNVSDLEVFGDDACFAHSLDLNDAPWDTQYPFVRMKGGISDMPPAADGARVEWNKGAGGWAEIDETGGNDGATTFNQETEENLRHLHQWTASNPIPVGATVHGVQFRMVSTETGDGKNPGNFYIEYGASPATGPDFSTSANYRGSGWVGVPQPGGDFQDWAQGDFDPGDWDFGFKAASADAGHRVTLMGGPVVLYTESGDLIPLHSTPPRSLVPRYPMHSIRPQLVR